MSTAAYPLPGVDQRAAVLDVEILDPLPSPPIDVIRGPGETSAAEAWEVSCGFVASAAASLYAA